MFINPYRQLLMLMLVCGQTMLFAQTNLNTPCGFQVQEEYLLDLEKHQAGLKYWEDQFRTVARSRTNELTAISLAVHVGQSTITNRQAIDTASLQANVDFVNEVFEDVGIRFKIASIKDVQNEVFFRVGEVSSELLNSTKVPNHLNLYVPNDFEFDGLYGYASVGSHLVIKSRILSPENFHVLAHEIGHFFGLFHTHGKFNNSQDFCAFFHEDASYVPKEIPIEAYCAGAKRFDEPIDSNHDGIRDCEQTGDNICDTPAEPVLSRWMDENCNYIGTERDVFGDLFTPNTDNLMSYTFGCESVFTPDQYARMFASLMEFNQDLLCPASATQQESNKLLVNNTADECMGSFRWAVETANNKIGVDTIIFDTTLFSSPTPIFLLKSLTIDSDIVIQGNGNVILDGQESDPTRIGRPTDIVIGNANNVHLEGLQIVNMANVGLLIVSSQDIQLTNCKVSNNQREGLYINDCQNIAINNCAFSNNQSTGCSIYNSENVLIEHTEVRQNRSGVSVRFGAFITMTNCQIHNNEYSGLLVSRSSEEIEVRQSQLTDNGNYGIFAGSSKKLLFEDLSIQNNQYRGIHIGDNCREVVIKKAEVINNGDIGITLDSSKIVAIVNCLVKDHAEMAGVAICNESSHATIYESTIVNSGNHGLSISKSENIDIEKTSISNNGQSGISIAEAEDINITDGIVFENELTGLYSKESSFVTLQQVETYSNQLGLYLYQSEFLELSDCTINNNDIGIDIDKSNAVSLNNCQLRNNEHAGLFIHNKAKYIVVTNSELNNNGDGISISTAAQYISLQHVLVHNNTKVGVKLANTRNTSLNKSQVFDNASHGIEAISTPELVVDSTLVYCNEGMQIESENQSLTPSVRIIDTSILGTASPNSDIYVYKNVNTCTSCGAEQLLGTTTADASGHWNLELPDSEEDCYTITAFANIKGYISPLVNCLNVAVNPVACAGSTVSTNTLAGNRPNLSTIDPPSLFDFDLTITPTLIDNQFSVLWNTKKAHPFTLQILSLSGQILHQVHLTTASQTEQDVSYLSSGVYLVRVVQKQESRTFKIVKR